MSAGKQVGILAAEIYFPKHFVDQKDLEKFDGVSGTVIFSNGYLQSFQRENIQSDWAKKTWESFLTGKMSIQSL